MVLSCLPGVAWCPIIPFLPPRLSKWSFPASLVLRWPPISPFLPPWCLPGASINPFLPPWCLPSCPIGPSLPLWCLAGYPIGPFLPPWCLPGCPNGPFLPPWCLAGCPTGHAPYSSRRRFHICRLVPKPNLSLPLLLLQSSRHVFATGGRPALRSLPLACAALPP